MGLKATYTYSGVPSLDLLELHHPAEWCRRYCLSCSDKTPLIDQLLVIKNHEDRGAPYLHIAVFL